MKEIIRENIHTEYSLHDTNVIAFDIHDNNIIMKTQSGMIKVSEPCLQVDGHIEFQDVKTGILSIFKKMHITKSKMESMNINRKTTLYM